MKDLPVAESLLDILACPACDNRPKVKCTGDTVRCPGCGRIYPVKNGIPVMLVENAVFETDGKGD